VHGVYARISDAQSVNEAVAIARVSTGHAEQQCGLVDDKQIVIAIEQANRFL